MPLALIGLKWGCLFFLGFLVFLKVIVGFLPFLKGLAITTLFLGFFSKSMMFKALCRILQDLLFLGDHFLKPNLFGKDTGYYEMTEYIFGTTLNHQLFVDWLSVEGKGFGDKRTFCRSLAPDGCS